MSAEGIAGKKPFTTGIGAGAAYGTAKSGIGIAGVGTFRPDLIMKVRIQTPRASGTDNLLLADGSP